MKLKHTFDRFNDRRSYSEQGLAEQRKKLREASVHLHRALVREDTQQVMRFKKVKVDRGPDAVETLFATVSTNMMMSEHLASAYVRDQIQSRLLINEERRKGLKGNLSIYVRTDPDLYGAATKAVGWAGNRDAQRLVRHLIASPVNWTVSYDVLIAALLMGATTVEDVLALADFPLDLVETMLHAEVEKREKVEE